MMETVGNVANERQFPIVGMERAVMMHDFAITENYAIFLDLPLFFKPEAMLRGKVPIVFDKTQHARYVTHLPSHKLRKGALFWRYTSWGTGRFDPEYGRCALDSC